MKKQSITINIPEGFTVSGGQQPRCPVEGDFYLGPSGEVKEAHIEFTHDKFIILEKEMLEYHTSSHKVLSPYSYNGYKEIEMVELQALEDALGLLVVQDTGWSSKHQNILDSLNKLL